MEKQGYVYILAKRKHGALYIGVTSDLLGRLCQHREGLIRGHSTRYGIDRLIYFETFSDMTSAITREKQLKKWNRDWKLNLIEGSNPEWVDLAIGFGFDPTKPKARK